MSIQLTYQGLLPNAFRSATDLNEGIAPGSLNVFLADQQNEQKQRTGTSDATESCWQVLHRET